uniref:Serine/threonine protein kinase n=1 Tax=Schlesneria paludicola TaxID=360056 RepID=A0A7C2NZ04_9PLAN
MTSAESPLEAIFSAALAIESPEQQAGNLDAACAGQPELRRRVEQLLAAQRRLGRFLDLDAADAERGAATAPLVEQPGMWIGPYRLMEQIGEGGMGLVFVAEQESPLRRKVALKVLKPGMDTRDVMARFEAERQALALMDHPHIAKVHDAGATPSGRPYFVMELVRGVPIIEFCDQNRLSVRQRLDLFVDVCLAVQHAHQKGIIHRDLKPGNVLVTLHDGRQVVKVIDFGVAKALGERLTERTIYTRFLQMIGTPLYMSPEQAEMSGLDVDTRSDIYSLGVLLYELLVGVTPFDVERLRTAAFDEVRRIIREEDPPKPSTRASTLRGAARTTIMTGRGIDSQQLGRLLQGELDWIVMKALEKDRTRRYESASSFAADIRRYLADEPVEASPPSVLYRYRKFARRHRGLMFTAAAVTVALIAGTAASLWQAALARAARDQANDRLAGEQRARGEADAARRESEVQRREADRQRLLAEENFQKALEAVDRMLTRVGEDRLKDLPNVEPVRKLLLEDALQFYQDFLSQKADDPALRAETAKAYQRVAEISEHLGRFAQAETAARSSHAMWEELSKTDPRNREYRTGLAITGGLLRWLCWKQVRVREAEEWSDKTLSLWQTLRSEFPEVSDYQSQEIVAQRWRANIYRGTGRPELAEEIFRRVLPAEEEYAAQRPHESNTQLGLATGYREFAELMADRNRPDEAERSFRRALEVQERAARGAPTDPQQRNSQIYIRWVFGKFLRNQKRYDEAEEILREALALSIPQIQAYENIPRYRWLHAWLHHDLAKLLITRGRVADAEPSSREAFVHSLRVLVDSQATRENLNLFDSSLNLRLQALKQRDPSEVGQVAHEALALYDRLAGDGQPELVSWLADNYVSLAAYLAQANRLDDVEQVLARLAKLPETDSADDDAVRRQTLARKRILTGRLLWAGGHLESGEGEYRRGLEACERSWPVSGPSLNDRWFLGDHYIDMGHALAAAGHSSEAEQAYRLAREIMQVPAAGPEDDQKRWEMGGGSHDALGACLAASGNYAEAEEVLRKAVEFNTKLAEHPDQQQRPYARQELAGRYHNLGLALAGLGRRDEAIEALQQAIALREQLAEQIAPTSHRFADGGVRAYTGPEFVAHVGRHVHLGGLALSRFKLAQLIHARGDALEARSLLILAIDSQQAAIDAPGCPTTSPYYRYLLGHYRGMLQILVALDDLPPRETAPAHAFADRWEEYYRPAGSVAGCSSLATADLYALEQEALASATAAAVKETLLSVLKRSRRQPRGAHELNNLAWLLATHPIIELRDPSRAVELARQANRDEPNRGHYLNTLGVAQYRTGDWSSAVQSLEASQQLLRSEGRALNLFFLAMAHWQLGEQDLADLQMREAAAWMDDHAPDDAQLQRFRNEAAELVARER